MIVSRQRTRNALESDTNAFVDCRSGVGRPLIGAGADSSVIVSVAWTSRSIPALSMDSSLTVVRWVSAPCPNSRADASCVAPCPAPGLGLGKFRNVRGPGTATPRRWSLVLEEMPFQLSTIRS